MKKWLHSKKPEDQQFILWVAAFIITNIIFVCLRPNFDLSDESLDTTILLFVYIGGGTWISKKIFDGIFDIKKPEK